MVIDTVPHHIKFSQRSSNVRSVRSHPNSTVRFNTQVKVVLIPTRRDMPDNMKKDLYWSKKDFKRMRNNTAQSDVSANATDVTFTSGTNPIDSSPLAQAMNGHNPTGNSSTHVVIGRGAMPTEGLIEKLPVPSGKPPLVDPSARSGLSQALAFAALKKAKKPNSASHTS